MIEEIENNLKELGLNIESGFKEISSLMNNSILSEDQRKEILKATNGLKESIKLQDTNKIFETLKNFNNADINNR
jgi:phosphoenolpyruvate synthase/pyruvate phosphate dikinase